MRHSDPKLTSKVYTDSSLLPIAAELLKVYMPTPACLHIGSRKPGKSCPKPSDLGQTGVSESAAKAANLEQKSLIKSGKCLQWPALSKSGQTEKVAERVGVEPFLLQQQKSFVERALDC